VAGLAEQVGATIDVLAALGVAEGLHFFDQRRHLFGGEGLVHRLDTAGLAQGFFKRTLDAAGGDPAHGLKSDGFGDRFAGEFLGEHVRQLLVLQEGVEDRHGFGAGLGGGEEFGGALGGDLRAGGGEALHGEAAQVGTALEELVEEVA